jgi:hypothetical protein
MPATSTETLVAAYQTTRRAYGEFRPLPGESELAWQVRQIDARTDYLVAVRELERHILLYGGFVSETHHYHVRGGKLRVTPLRQAFTVARSFYAA